MEPQAGSIPSPSLHPLHSCPDSRSHRLRPSPRHTPAVVPQVLRRTETPSLKVTPALTPLLSSRCHSAEAREAVCSLHRGQPLAHRLASHPPAKTATSNTGQNAPARAASRHPGCCAQRSGVTDAHGKELKPAVVL